MRIFAAGSHPISRPEEQEIVPEERYIAFVDYAGISARRQGVNGLHVHVGMPDADTCMRALEGACSGCPVVLAVSANSPYLAGEETGLASNRAEMLAQLPRSGAPPPFRDYAEREAFIGRLVAVGLVPDYTMFWWDVRPHPRFGTLEIRMPDQPTSVAVTAGLVALLQALCVSAARRDAAALRSAGPRGLPAEPLGGAARRARRGAAAPGGDRLVPARGARPGARRARRPVAARARIGAAARGARSRPHLGRAPARGRPPRRPRALMAWIVERSLG